MRRSRVRSIPRPPRKARIWPLREAVRAGSASGDVYGASAPPASVLVPPPERTTPCGASTPDARASSLTASLEADRRDEQRRLVLSEEIVTHALMVKQAAVLEKKRLAQENMLKVIKRIEEFEARCVGLPP